ncbi:MAG: bifunctional methylenetetrahydrofolate dehydrogenase/methenyltetrahydrofolate cyclohydrolase FolD [Candidatus Bipolaricaulota bacterium]|nr:MAG: bifunctional methylenetetrahydrofolate dehydrogenase/methenyltetrahydrofolate cyclohydrolase FolD [Candidatus Bipolaricaulota bacterium]
MPQAQIIDGKAVAAALREQLKGEVDDLIAHGVTPGLATVLVGEDPASQVYVRMKEKACDKLGIASHGIRPADDIEEPELIAQIEALNADPAIHGILVQLPLPKHLNTQRVLRHVSPEKDVDGFHPLNLGRLLSAKSWDELPRFIPCTPAGAIRLIDSTGVEIEGKEAVVVGRSLIVGKPVALLLLARHATVTLCHSRTSDLAEITRRADILVAAVGVPRLVTAEMVKPGAVVIDVGVNRLDDGLVGDVDFDAVCEVASHITPVPGGVGPMTITMLLANTVRSAQAQLAR